MLRLSGLILATMLVVSPAFAHTGTGDASGVALGFMHPIGGPDHVLAMVAVGLFAALLRGRALWLVPASFIGMMAVGAGLAMAAVHLPVAEIGIGLSVVALGAAIALRLNPPVAAAMAFVGFFAIFHGYAHGAEMPETMSGFAYGIGFMLASVMLHAVGIGLAAAIGRIGEFGAPAARAAGSAIAVAGLVLLVQMV